MYFLFIISGKWFKSVVLLYWILPIYDALDMGLSWYLYVAL